MSPVVMKKFKKTAFFLALIVSAPVLGQNGIGIGTESPHASTILHISSPTNDKGVMFPTATGTTLFDNKSAAINGLMMYVPGVNRFAYLKNNLWMYMNPWDTEEIQNNSNVNYMTTPYKVGIGITGEPDESLEVSGNVKADAFDGFGIVPIGAIIMWSGTSGNVPPGWELCDGSPSTVNGVAIPNLLNRFIMAGAGQSSGGNNTLGTTEISYVHTPEYIINGTNCQVESTRYSFSFIQVCPIVGTTTPVNISQVPAASCAAAQSPYRGSHTGPGGAFCYGETDSFSSCASFANPNYYLTNPACHNSAVQVLDVVTATDNRPQYYSLAFIIRVE